MKFLKSEIEEFEIFEENEREKNGARCRQLPPAPQSGNKRMPR